MSASRRKAPKGITLAMGVTYDPILKIKTEDRDVQNFAEERRRKVATPERVAKAVIAGKGADNSQHLTNAPLDVLFQRKQLAKDKYDTHGQRVLFDAGDRFRRHWHHAGLIGVQAMDFNRPGGGARLPNEFPFPEFVCQHRDEVYDAAKVLGPHMAKYVIGIVAEERPLEDVGSELSGRIDRTTAIAVSVEILRAALTSLAQHWGMLRRT